MEGRLGVVGGLPGLLGVPLDAPTSQLFGQMGAQPPGCGAPAGDVGGDREQAVTGEGSCCTRHVFSPLLRSRVRQRAGSLAQSICCCVELLPRKGGLRFPNNCRLITQSPQQVMKFLLVNTMRDEIHEFHSVMLLHFCLKLGNTISILRPINFIFIKWDHQRGR